MREITFFRQKRADGGIRTGIEVEGLPVFQQFHIGNKETDPALLWYVDLQFTGNALPAGADQIREWLLSNGSVIAGQLYALADKVPAGFDSGEWPLVSNFAMGKRIKGVISCSAIRRLTAKKIADILRDMADHWAERIEELASYQPN